MRILHVVAGGGWGGAERIACAIAKGSTGDEVAALATPECAPGVAKEGLRLLDAGDSLARPASHDPTTLVAWALGARRHAREFRADVVHVHLSTPAFASAAAVIAGSAPSVWTFHLLPENDWPLDFMLRLPSEWPLRWAERRHRAVFVAVSRADATLLEARFPRSSVRCIRNVPPPAEDDTGAVERTAWGTADHALLFVGRLVAQKGVDRLLRALASPRLASKSFRLLVIGDGPERGRLAQIAEGLGDRVSFLGAGPSRSAMAAADFVICPSRYEGMPLVPMEAIFSGSAVLASSIAPHRELLAEHADALLPDDEGLWPESLERWMSGPERRRGLVGRQSSLRARFSLEQLLGEYRDAYALAVADATRPPAEPRRPRGLSPD